MRTIHYAVLNKISSLCPHPQAVLDIGCGDGLFTQTVSTVYPNAKITATDISVPNQVISDKISFIECNVEELPFASESFDLVYTVLSLHHWKNKNKGIKEIHRVLKKNGLLIIGDPLLEDWMSNKFLGWLMQKIDGGIFTDENKIRKMLTSAEFQDINVRLIPKTIKSLYLITAKK